MTNDEKKKLYSALSQPFPAEAIERTDGRVTGRGYNSVTEAGAVAGVHAATIRAWIRQGRLPQHRAGRHYRVKSAELRLLLDGAGTKAPTPTVKLDDMVETRAKRMLSSLSKAATGNVSGHS